MNPSSSAGEEKGATGGSSSSGSGAGSCCLGAEGGADPRGAGAAAAAALEEPGAAGPKEKDEALEEINFPEAGLLQVGARAWATGRQVPLRGARPVLRPRRGASSDWGHLSLARSFCLSLCFFLPLLGCVFTSHPIFLGWREATSARFPPELERRLVP